MQYRIECSTIIRSILQFQYLLTFCEVASTSLLRAAIEPRPPDEDGSMVVEATAQNVINEKDQSNTVDVEIVCIHAQTINQIDQSNTW